MVGPALGQHSHAGGPHFQVSTVLLYLPLFPFSPFLMNMLNYKILFRICRLVICIISPIQCLLFSFNPSILSLKQCIFYLCKINFVTPLCSRVPLQSLQNIPQLYLAISTPTEGRPRYIVSQGLRKKKSRGGK